MHENYILNRIIMVKNQKPTTENKTELARRKQGESLVTTKTKKFY